MVAGDSPNWLESPQHVVAGIGLAVVLFALARLTGLRIFAAVVVAVGLTSMAEILVELVEYPLLYSDRFHRSAYYDTLADMASTLVGAGAGAVLAATVAARRGTRREPAHRSRRDT